MVTPRWTRSPSIASPLLAVGGLVVSLAGCEGDGGSGGLVIRNRITAEHCTPPPSASPFPPGLAILSAARQLAVVTQDGPNAILTYDLRGDRPRAIATHTLGVDSDADGIDDETAMRQAVGRGAYPKMGEVRAPDDGVALVSTSDYEQVLAFDPTTGQPVTLAVEGPEALAGIDYPLLPQPGIRAQRTGLSTLACVAAPAGALDSRGRPITADPVCDPTRPSFRTSFTAGKARAAGRLFVATSNLELVPANRFLPGTLLVFDWREGPGGIEIEPSARTPVLFTSGFNPTGVATFRTPGGRELVLVTVTGAIGAGVGTGNVLTDSFVDVVDPAIPRIVATVPLGRAGPAFDAPAIDPGGRIAWLGASSSRQLYAIDLRPLDDPRVHEPRTEPLLLDGLSLGALDARIFTADRPLAVPPRSDGRSSSSCEGLTDATVNAAGSEVFASDYCDGTITRIALDLGGDPPAPYPPTRFRVTAQSNTFAPHDAVGESRTPGLLAARPGIPGIDYTSPDVLVLVGQELGQICALRIESR